MKLYTVEGDLTADKSSDAYPMMTLCDNCVEKYTVVTTEGSSEGPCEGFECEEDE
ncbi:hypothetical protein [Vibrio sp. 03-59-1]|uniref:hypothetical protein n=1 Tax=Vibrio sp. 03-59-1 TaxID=2607607 RepID=UPI00149360BC|nr:hypothetical protein [Vibrio sp. 03-59-1]